MTKKKASGKAAKKDQPMTGVLEPAEKPEKPLTVFMEGQLCRCLDQVRRVPGKKRVTSINIACKLTSNNSIVPIHDLP